MSGSKTLLPLDLAYDVYEIIALEIGLAFYQLLLLCIISYYFII